MREVSKYAAPEVEIPKSKCPDRHDRGGIVIWWRRGRVELPVQRNLLKICYKLSRLFVLAQLASINQV